MKSTVAEMIYKAYEDKNSSWFRSHLGASEIGGQCERKVWLTWKWAGKEKFSGRMLRLFETGKREEQRVIDNLSLAGLEVRAFDHATGKQFSYLLGHFGGSLDGIVRGVPEHPDEEMVLEVKTHNAKSFRELERKGVCEAKEEHWCQCQTYMGMSGLKKALYIAVEKDTDTIHAEIVEFDGEAFEALVKKAERIIYAEHAPAKIATNADYYLCKMCQFRELCHGLNGTLPNEVNCRTCIHSSAELDGSWSCAHWDKGLSSQEQKRACPEHLFHINMVPKRQIGVDANGIIYDGVKNLKGGDWMGS